MLKECSVKLSTGPGNSISYKIICPPSNDSEQPAKMRRLIRFIAWRSMGDITASFL